MLVDSKAKRGWWFWWWSPACLIARWLMQSMMPSLWPHDRPAAWGNMLLVMSCLICWWLGDSTRAALQVAAKPGTWLRVLKEIKAWETRGNWKGCCLLIACCVYASLNLTQVSLSSSSMFSYLFSCLKWSPFRAEPSIARKLWTKSQRIAVPLNSRACPHRRALILRQVVQGVSHDIYLIYLCLQTLICVAHTTICADTACQKNEFPLWGQGWLKMWLVALKGKRVYSLA